MAAYSGQLIDALCALWLVLGCALLVARGLNRVAPAFGYTGLWLAGSGALASAIEPHSVSAAILAVGLIAPLLHFKPGARRNPFGRARSRPSRPFKPWDQEGELLRLCHGDKTLMERLIQHERERKPGLSRAGAALAAATAAQARQALAP